MSLDNIHIGVSPITNTLYIYRHGKNSPEVALEKRKAEPEIMKAVIEFMMYDAPKGASQEFKISEGDEVKFYKLSVVPIDGFSSSLAAPAERDK